MNRTNTLATALSTGDLERGRTKDLGVFAGTELDDSAVLQTRPRITVATQPIRSNFHKYLLLAVFCLGVFIDGQSHASGLCARYELTLHQYSGYASSTSSWRLLHMIWILSLSSKLGLL